MKLRVHQAVYGEQKNGHALLAYTPLDRTFLDELKLLTDLPDSQPPDITWEPFISGFGIESYYVFSKTFPDPQAPRSGMVLTHALILDREEVINSLDISPILRLLPPRLEKRNSLQELILNVSDASDSLFVHTVDKVEKSFSKLVNVMLKNSSSSLPIVWVGQDGFESILTFLWYSLWPEARNQLAFRLSFGPNDVENRQLTIVSTPASLEHKWGNYHTIHYGEEHSPDSLAEAFLLGLPEGQQLRDFQGELGVSLTSLGDLKKLEQAYKYVDVLNDLKPDAIRSLVHFIAMLSPDKKNGIVVKKSVLERLAHITKTNDAVHIKGLRNIKLDFCQDGFLMINEAIKSWLMSNAYRKKPDEIAPVVLEALSKPETQWSLAVQDGLKDIFRTWDHKTAVCVWACWKKEPTLVEMLEKFISKRKDIEKLLTDTCPSTLPNNLGNSICSFSWKRKWYSLHAVVASAYLIPLDAFKSQLHIDQDSQHLEGLRVLASRVQPLNLIEASLAFDDERLLQIAGETCAEKSALLKHLDVKNQKWRAIWHYSIQKSNDPWNGIAAPSEIMDELMQLLVQGQNLEDELLLKLGHTRYGDLSTHPKRNELWSNMVPAVRQIFLSVTAKGWIERFWTNPDFDAFPEQPLRDEILQPELGLLKTNSPNAFSVGMIAFQKFSSLSEAKFINWLHNVLVTKKYIEPIDANLLGNLIIKRNWRSAANKLYDIYYSGWPKRDDLFPALSACRSLLTWSNLIWLRLSGKLGYHVITSDDIWSALQELATDLYSHGIDDQHIWERANGDSSQINTDQAGGDQWRSAIKKLRRGGGGPNITFESLLREMRFNYPNNDKLKLLERLGIQKGL